MNVVGGGLWYDQAVKRQIATWGLMNVVGGRLWYDQAATRQTATWGSV